MSRSSTPAPAAVALSSSLLLLMLMLMPRSAAAEIAASNGSCDLKSCALLEASALEEYVSGLNASGLPLSDAGSGNGTLLPFGALPSDWSRLLLLQNSQPEGTPLRDSLLRLSRLVLASYFDSQERLDWTDHHGRGGGAAAGAASEAESEDQQANNATSGSTARKGSTRINASPIGAAAYNNGGSQPSGGNFSGREEDDPTTSHYSAAEGANFNQTFSSADNEASGSKSNETSPAAPGYPDDDSSAANEVLHERSREELRRGLQDGDSSSASDESLSFEFNSTKSVEEFFASAEGKVALVDDFLATEAAAANETEAPLDVDLFASSEEDAPLTKSVEDFFASSAEASATPSRSVEDFFRSAEATTPGDPSGDPSTAAGISEDSGESRKNGDNPGATTTTTTMARLISGEVGGATPAGAPVAGENRTSDRPDDLFSESTTTQRRPGDDWNSTSAGSIEPASDRENPPAATRLLRSIPQYLHGEASPAAAQQPVPPPPAPGDSREEDATTSTRNRHQRRVRRNKRRTRKRAGAEPDVEGQYPSFDGREPGQALLAEERSAENSERSLQ